MHGKQRAMHPHSFALSSQADKKASTVLPRRLPWADSRSQALNLLAGTLYG